MANLSCGDKCAKWLLFAFNVIFWLAGVLFVVVAILVVVNANIGNWQVAATSNGVDLSAIRTGAWVLLGVGIFMIVVGFAGCCGAIMENIPLIVIYLIFLFITIAVEIAIAIYVGVKKDSVYDDLQKALLDTLNNYSKDNVTRDSWDAAQKGMSCCGVRSYNDWINNSTLKAVPISCCKNDNTCATDKIYFAQGCMQSLVDWLKTFFPILIGIAAGIAGLELLGVLLACCLCCALRNKKALA